MSCLCQYIADVSGSANGANEPIGFPLPDQNCAANRQQGVPALNQAGPANAPAGPVTDDIKINVCVSEMAECRAENWLLKKQLEESKAAVKNLEELMATILNKQYLALSHIKKLRRRNEKLETEAYLQRQYHTIERDALIKELYNVKKLSGDKDVAKVHSEYAEQLKSEWKDANMTDDDEETGFGDEENLSEFSELSSSPNDSDSCESDDEAGDDEGDEDESQQETEESSLNC